MSRILGSLSIVMKRPVLETYAMAYSYRHCSNPSTPFLRLQLRTANVTPEKHAEIKIWELLAREVRTRVL